MCFAFLANVSTPLQLVAADSPEEPVSATYSGCACGHWSCTGRAAAPAKTIYQKCKNTSSSNGIEQNLPGSSIKKTRLWSNETDPEMDFLENRSSRPSSSLWQEHLSSSWETKGQICHQTRQVCSHFCVIKTYSMKQLGCLWKRQGVQRENAKGVLKRPFGAIGSHLFGPALLWEQLPTVLPGLVQSVLDGQLSALHLVHDAQLHLIAQLKAQQPGHESRNYGSYFPLIMHENVLVEWNYRGTAALHVTVRILYLLGP